MLRHAATHGSLPAVGALTRGLCAARASEAADSAPGAQALLRVPGSLDHELPGPQPRRLEAGKRGIGEDRDSIPGKPRPLGVVRSSARRFCRGSAREQSGAAPLAIEKHPRVLRNSSRDRCECKLDAATRPVAREDGGERSACRYLRGRQGRTLLVVGIGVDAPPAAALFVAALLVARGPPLRHRGTERTQRELVSPADFSLTTE